MDFTPDDTQAEITALGARVLAKSDEPAQQWRALADAGLLTLALPADLGGDGLGVAEVAPVLTEVGRAAAAVPAYAVLALGILPVEALGTPSQRAELLPPAAAGESLLTAALHEPSAPLTTLPATRGTASAGVWELTGVKTHVPYAAESARILTPVALPGGIGVALVRPRAEGVEVLPTHNAGGTPEYTVRFDRVRIDDSDFLRDRTPGHAVATLHRLALAGALAWGDGLLAGALALTSRYVGERTQFGRPLAGFQAVAQQIADVYVASRTVHLATVSAVWRLAAGLNADAELEVAAYWLAQETPSALAICHHLHGGVGVDRSYPLHRYSSAVKDLGHAVGGAAHRLGRLGERVAG
ncbi:acyl-CoA dehydrogenase family protein [Amycolatopsis jiangsuensis]|uniref:Alkylation response protein AidB-like acyl-CoA dehydrogenase n=1 Tax=Amycolatopsis jiangsuensis TaxID=1181879 RepID=A0A840IQM8_9PSEU|nr:acyl-CoA dehydrogenase family protein [Amycolatopsis jiangsuensis]MBB4684871.1 alkylation response protein AidB-like acyl-CoA dehydrogenase [Amycolatopsis jiangsuensis]